MVVKLWTDIACTVLLQGKANIDVKLDPVWKSNADVEQQNGRVTVRSV
jgi:hypothetical protein